jgi:bifunctional DNA-binding transcriptional regulator/antitoxin component of YhaV-PrlF toxin-antitoxin module
MKASSIVSSKRQRVIPANLSKRYGLTEGTTVVFHEDRVRLVLAPRNHQAIYALEASLAGFPLQPISKLNLCDNLGKDPATRYLFAETSRNQSRLAPGPRRQTASCM